MANSGYLVGILLKYAIIPTVVVAAGAYRLRQTKRHIATDARTLSDWALSRGWRIVDPDDPVVIAELTAMNGLLAEEGVRAVGLVVAGENAFGKIVIVASYRSDQVDNEQAEVGPSVDISFASNTSEAPGMCHITKKGDVKPFLDSRTPTPAEAIAVDGLPEGTRLRVMSDRLLLRRPGFVTPAQADWLLKRLACLSEAQAPQTRL